MPKGGVGYKDLSRVISTPPFFCHKMNTFSEEEKYILFAMMMQDLRDLRDFLRRRSMLYRWPRWDVEFWSTQGGGGAFWFNRLLKKHKNKEQRFQLTRFLVFNGLPLAMATKWVMFGDANEYDADAWRDQLQLGKFKGGRLWDISAGEVVEFADQI